MLRLGRVLRAGTSVRVRVKCGAGKTRSGRRRVRTPWQNTSRDIPRRRDRAILSVEAEEEKGYGYGNRCRYGYKYGYGYGYGYGYRYGYGCGYGCGYGYGYRRFA